MTFPHIRVTGDARERGRGYGAQAGVRVRRSVEAYAVIFEHYAGWDWDRVRVEADRYTEPITTFGPTFVDEIRGIAEGADLAYEDVLAINVRTEVMYAAKARNAAITLPRTLECTAFAAVPGDDTRPVLVGQNWDWKTHASETTVVLESEPDDGPRFVTVVEAGLLAKAGFNAAGIGVVTNALVTDQDLGVPGVPYHVLLRALFDATTPADALATLQRATRSSSAHYLVAHRDHLALGVEAAPGGFSDLYPLHPDARGTVLHTNHFTHPRMEHVDVSAWLMPDSLFRLQRADRWLDRADAFDPATYEALLSDHAGHPTGVCCHPDLSAIAPEQDSTVFSLVMDLDAMTMRLADGRPCETGYRTLDYADFLSGTGSG